MGGTVVGVDIGSQSIRGVEVQGFDTAKPVVLRMHEVPVPGQAVRRGEVVEQSTVATALRRLWSTGGFKTRDAVLGIGGGRVFARDLAVPFATLPQIRQSLPFHVQDLLPVPVADALLDFYPIAEQDTEGGRQISGLLVAAVKEAVNANVTAALAGGLNPVKVDFIPFALTRAVAPRRSARGRDLLVGMGANTTNVVVHEDGVPSFVRIIPSGGADVTNAIVQRLQFSPEQAEGAKRALGMGTQLMRQEDRPVIEIIYEVVGELLTSIRSTLSYYANQRPSEPVSRIVLTGGGAHLNGLPKAFADLTSMPVVVADAFAQVTSKSKEQYTPEQRDGYAVALGLALGSRA